MKIAVVGTGYVGLVTGTCLAETGNDVTCVDCDAEKIAMLRQGQVPIYEPGLAELVARNVAAGRLSFTTDLAVRNGRVAAVVLGDRHAFLARRHGGPVGALVGGRRDRPAPQAGLRSWCSRARCRWGPTPRSPPGWSKLTGFRCQVASNPEFLKEGAAIEDFMKPDRVVIGARRDEIFDILGELYQPYLRTDKPLLCMSPESAEMTKYAANCAVGHEDQLHQRDGQPLPKDRGRHQPGPPRHRPRQPHRLRLPLSRGGLRRQLLPQGPAGLGGDRPPVRRAPAILEAVDEVNQRQKQVLVEKIEAHFQGRLADKRIAVWGLAFKPGTDDIREAPSLVLLDRLLAHRAIPQVYDPEALENIRRRYGPRLTYAAGRDEALDGADALAILTEWKQFLHPDFERMKSRMRSPVIFDGRNLYSPFRMRDTGFTYYSIGRPEVIP